MQDLIVSIKPKVGRPEHVPTQHSIDLAKTLAGLGMPNAGIARRIGVNVDTLVKYYKEHLEEGIQEANATVAGVLFKKALEGDNACMMFWLKTRAKWREVHHTEITGLDGSPIQFEKIQFELIREGTLLPTTNNEITDT